MDARRRHDLSGTLQMLADEARRSPEARYDHRLHAVLLVARGMTCSNAAVALGEPRRTVLHWVSMFEAQGLSGLTEAPRPGRPARLNGEQRQRLRQALHQEPAMSGLSARAWDSKLLASYIAAQMQVTISARHCQRLLQELGAPQFRARRARPRATPASLEAAPTGP